jgi:signal peptidase I
MNLLPKTEFGTYYKSPDKYKTLVVWRKWLWFSYGSREFKITGFYVGTNKFENCTFGEGTAPDPMITKPLDPSVGDEVEIEKPYKVTEVEINEIKHGSIKIKPANGEK